MNMRRTKRAIKKAYFGQTLTPKEERMVTSFLRHHERMTVRALAFLNRLVWALQEATRQFTEKMMEEMMQGMGMTHPRGLVQEYDQAMCRALKGYDGKEVRNGRNT